MLRAAFSLLFSLNVLLVSIGEAATYYVRTGGNDNADGRSDGAAWASLTKVNQYAFAAGDIVLLRAGDRFTGTLTIDWAGTATQPAVVGSYYLGSSGAPTRGYQTGRPVIDGGGTLPSGHYDALVRVRADRVRVENIKVINSEGRGIDLADSDDSAVVGCSADNVYNSGIHVLRSARVMVENNYVAHAGTGGPRDGAPWGGAIEVVRSSDVKVRTNVVSEVHGEGINTNDGSTATLIEGNRVYAARAVGIYADAAPDTTIRRNVVLGTTNTLFWRTARTVGAGIALNNEKYHYEATSNALPTGTQTQRAKIYGNLVAFTSSGLSMWGELATSTFDGTLIFNNTLVDNDTQMTLQSGRPRPSSRFINNILLSLSSGTRDVNGTDLGGMVAKNNYFSQGNPGGGYTQTGNRYSGLQLERMSGWRQIVSSDEVTWRDFTVIDGSTVIAAGDEEPRQMAEGDDTFQLDHNVAAHNAPMDMGAVRFVTAIKLPSPPENLALVE
jgi:parallel beta-helix repeat protein